MKKPPIYAVMCAFVTLVGCQPYRLTRIGYENLRQVQDTTCPLRTIDPGAGIPEGEKIGRVILDARTGNKNRSKQHALAIAKMEACAVNAATLYIVQEQYAGDNPAKAYSCIIDLYRDTRKADKIPDFVKRAQSEARAAKEQRDRLGEIKHKLTDTAASANAADSTADTIAATSLRRDKTEGSTNTIQAPDTALLPTRLAAGDTAGILEPAHAPDPVKDKLKSGVFATVGHRFGGSTIAGLELEAAVWRIGIMGGAGVYGYSCGINFHILPDPLSSYVSCLYWQNGIGDFMRQSAAGAAFSYRGKRWLSMQLGVGKILDKGPEFNNFNDDYVLLYSIGAFVPF